MKDSGQQWRHSWVHQLKESSPTAEMAFFSYYVVPVGESAKKGSTSNWSVLWGSLQVEKKSWNIQFFPGRTITAEPALSPALKPHLKHSIAKSMTQLHMTKTLGFITKVLQKHAQTEGNTPHSTLLTEATSIHCEEVLIYSWAIWVWADEMLEPVQNHIWGIRGSTHLGKWGVHHCNGNRKVCISVVISRAYFPPGNTGFICILPKQQRDRVPIFLKHITTEVTTLCAVSQLVSQGKTNSSPASIPPPPNSPFPNLLHTAQFYRKPVAKALRAAESLAADCLLLHLQEHPYTLKYSLQFTSAFIVSSSLISILKI